MNHRNLFVTAGAALPSPRDIQEHDRRFCPKSAADSTIFLNLNPPQILTLQTFSQATKCAPFQSSFTPEKSSHYLFNLISNANAKVGMA